MFPDGSENITSVTTRVWRARSADNESLSVITTDSVASVRGACRTVEVTEVNALIDLPDVDLLGT
jgi:hypothetical protein